MKHVQNSVCQKFHRLTRNSFGIQVFQLRLALIILTKVALRMDKGKKKKKTWLPIEHPIHQCLRPPACDLPFPEQFAREFRRHGL